jgi:hypothetical protein
VRHQPKGSRQERCSGQTPRHVDSLIPVRGVSASQPPCNCQVVMEHRLKLVVVPCGLPQHTVSYRRSSAGGFPYHVALTCGSSAGERSIPCGNHVGHLLDHMWIICWKRSILCENHMWIMCWITCGSISGGVPYYVGIRCGSCAGSHVDHLLEGCHATVWRRSILRNVGITRQQRWGQPDQKSIWAHLVTILCR